MNRARSQIVDERTYWTVGRSPRATRDARAHLLPVYDEYLVAYRDREAVPHGPLTMTFGSRTVTFQHAVLVAGQVAGTWRSVRHAATPSIEIVPLRRLTTSEQRALLRAATRYGRFLGNPVTLAIR